MMSETVGVSDVTPRLGFHGRESLWFYPAVGELMPAVRVEGEVVAFVGSIGVYVFRLHSDMILIERDMVSTARAPH